MEMVAVAVTLFLVMDPLGNIPAFAAALKQVHRPRARR
jgi:small neutral amino acid transporter SnatA (MarC family)